MLEVTGKPGKIRGDGSGAATATAYQEDFAPETPLADNRVTRLTPVFLPIPKETKDSQIRRPVITGEVHYTGLLPIDGVVVGQLGSNGGSLAVRQRTGSVFASAPELSGHINFRDMVRVNGHIAGTVYSKSGTLIVDISATVDANVEVAVAVINGTVHGDIVAHQRIEIGPAARIHGNIWTRSIAIKDGAVFDGVCTMLAGSNPSD